ncbi:MAG: PQQ-binding-like beta-propeller repeat protein, partial [Phycisphaerae bacterium]
PAWSDEAPALDEWPSFQGGPTRSNVLNVNSSAGARLWAQSTLTKFGGEADSSTGIQSNINVGIGRRFAIRQPNAGMGRALNSYPVLSGGTIFLNANQQIMALNANAGTLLWSYPREAGTPTAPNQPNMGFYNDGQMPAPSHESCTVLGSRVFAILPAPLEANGGNGGGMRYMGGYMTTNSRLVALDRQTGAELWSVTSSSLPQNNKGALVFIGSPIATRQGVFVMARRAGGHAFTQLYLVRLDSQTGKVDWSCYLCSASSGGYYGMTAASLAIPMTTWADDRIYISTGQGAECAVDANVGRILWLQVTESAHTMLNQGNMMYGRPVEVAASWKLNPPLIWKDQLITAETGSAVRFYDRSSGQLLYKINPKDLSNAVMMPGIVGDTLITVGAKIHGVDLRTGKPAFEPINYPAAETGTLAGRAFLTAQYLYLPGEKGLMMVDLEQAIAGGKPGATASEVKPQVIAWPKIQGPDNREISAKSGNLLVTSEQVLVLTDQEIAGYSRWETARDKRLAAIRQNPTDPRPYLDLAEIAFRTAHLDLARQNMQLAVELANQIERNPLTTSPAATEPTPPSGAGNFNGTNSELLVRLYRINLIFAQQLLERKETEQRDEARFYFKQCQLTARTPDTNAEWRLLLAPLALTQQHFDEAANLYNEVLTDSTLRNAIFRRGESVARAGLAAEGRFRELIATQGMAALVPATRAANGDGLPTPTVDPAQIDSAGRARIYQPFETQAQALLVRGRAQQDAAVFRNLIDSYPNSLAALAAATDLANLAKAHHEPLTQIAALWWAYARTSDNDLRGRLAAEQAQAYVAMKRYATALGWLDRGAHHLPDLSWQNGTKTENFASLRQQIALQAPELATARAPKLALAVVAPGERPPAPSVISSAASLLVPVESNQHLRRPDLVTAYDAISGKITFVNMPTLATRSTGQMTNPGGGVLLGYVGDRAVLATPTGATAFDVNTGAIAWEITLELSAEDRAKRDQLQQRLRNVLSQGDGGARNRQMQLMIARGGNGMIDYEESVSYGIQPMGADPEQARALMLQQLLGSPGYTTMRIVGNRLVALSGH